MINEALFSSAAGDWQTPPELFAKLDSMFGPFDLDAAANWRSARVENYLSVADDALSQPWNGRVWLNPPYGRGIDAWIKKAHDEAMIEANADLVVCLLPARTDTKWFHELVAGEAAEVLFVEGRAKFLGGGYPVEVPNDEFLFLAGAGRQYTEGELSSAPFPSLVVVYRSPKSGRHPNTILRTLSGWRRSHSP